MDETRLEIFWTRKALEAVPHVRIATVGGILPAGRWEMLTGEAIHALVLGRHSFFVRADGREIDVVIGRHDGRWYLKGTVDDYSPKTLLLLPDGPPDDERAGATLPAVTGIFRP